MIIGKFQRDDTTFVGTVIGLTTCTGCVIAIRIAKASTTR